MDSSIIFSKSELFLAGAMQSEEVQVHVHTFYTLVQYVCHIDMAERA